MTLKFLTRRDRCDLIGRRAEKLTPEQAAYAWEFLSERLQELAYKEVDVPKFGDLIRTIRTATVVGKRKL